MEEGEEEEMEIEENIEVVQEANPEPLNPQPVNPVQEVPNTKNHGFMGAGLLPDPFSPEEEEEPMSDITDVEDEETRSVIEQAMMTN